MNNDPANMSRRLQPPHFLPGLSAVEGFVRSIAPGGALAVVRLTRADPHHGRVRRSNRDVTYCRYAFLVEYRFPRRAVVGGFPNAAGSRADIHDVWIALHYGEIVDSPAHRGRAKFPEFQILECIGGVWLIAG